MAHALGSRYNGQWIGNDLPLTCFTFQVVKHMTTVDVGYRGHMGKGIINLSGRSHGRCFLQSDEMLYCVVGEIFC